MNTTGFPAEELSTTQEYEVDTNGTWDGISPVQIIVPLFFSCCVVIGVIGNSLVIVVLVKIHKSSTNGLSNTNIFMLNLAVADLLFLILCVPFHTTVYTLPWWPFGQFFCYFAKYCEEASKIASAFTLAALSFDRFIAVALVPKSKIRTRKNAIRGLIFIWISAIGIATPVLYTREYTFYENAWVCAATNVAVRKPYEIILAFFGYLLPLLIIIGCYIGVVWRVRKSSKSSSAVLKSTKDAKKKVTVIVIVVIVTFMICWLPHYITVLWSMFDVKGFFGRSWTFGFRIMAHCLAYANSCMNPFIYAFVSRSFRQDFAKVLTCRKTSDFETTVGRVSEKIAKRSPTKPVNSENVGLNKKDSPDEVVGETETELLTEDVTFGTGKRHLSKM